jgi:hypothetical protein
LQIRYLPSEFLMIPVTAIWWVFDMIYSSDACI